MQENFNSAIRAFNRASEAMRYELGLEMGNFAELPKNAHVTGSHMREIVQQFRLFFRPENGLPFVDEVPEIEQDVTISGSTERKFPDVWPSRYVNISMNEAGFLNWEFDDNFNYVEVFRKYRALQPEFPLAFTELPKHSPFERLGDHVLQLRLAAESLGRLPVPLSWCRNVTYRRDENSGSYRDQIPDVTETQSEANALPTPGFLENIDFYRISDDLGFWYGGYYSTQYVVSYVKNPTSFPAAIRFYFADVPQTSGNGYFVLSPGDSDYVGFTVPSIQEQDRLISAQSFYPGDSVSAVTFQTVEFELGPGQEIVFPGSPETFPQVLRQTFREMIQDGTADGLTFPPIGARGMSRKTFLADWRWI